MNKTIIGNITLYHGDALEILPTLEKADAVITDPPYKLTAGGVAGNHDRLGGKFKEHSIKAKKHRRPQGKLRSYKDEDGYKNDGNIVPCDIEYQDFMPLIYNCLKADAKAFVMANDKNLRNCLNSAINCGFKEHNVFVWFKNNSMINGWGMKNCEYIPCFYKGRGKRFYNCSVQTACLLHDNPMDKEHPTVKPIGLIEDLIMASTKQDELIIDPFGGSGTTAIACHKLNRRCIIIEKDKQYFDLMVKRITEVVDVNSIFNF